VVAATALALGSAALAGCGGAPASSTGPVSALGAENQYASVIAAIGGRYVTVASVLDNPNVDPHSFEVSTRVAREVAGAQLIVQNGLGYDAFMDDLESASAPAGRRVLVAQDLRGLSSGTFNPHLWYAPATMPVVARAIEHALAELRPSHAAYFASRLAAFTSSLAPWRAQVGAFRVAHHAVAAATTEPVADDLLAAMGISVRTPRQFEADVMNGVDPSPQDISSEERLISHHEVALFVYNEQVTDSLTASLRSLAVASHVPVVAVYETMPAGYNYPGWMRAETSAIVRALDDHVSTERL
jgi:zinc/manganese transport system substrate-binding protein